MYGNNKKEFDCVQSRGEIEPPGGQRDSRTRTTPTRVTVSRDHNNKSRFDQLEVSLRTEKENEK